MFYFISTPTHPGGRRDDLLDPGPRLTKGRSTLGCRFEAMDFGISEKAVLARRQIAEREGSKAHALEFQYRVADRLQHALYLMRPPFVNRQLDPGILFGLSDLLDLRGRGEPILQFDPDLEVPKLLAL